MELSTPVTPLNPDFKNRSTGLVVFGIFLLVISLLSFLMAAFIPLAMIMTRYADIPGAVQVDLVTVIPGVIVYALIGILFAVLGSGSILARRWARALILVLSWLWVACGVFSLLSISFVLAGAFEDQNLPPGTLNILLAVFLIFYCLLFLVIPLCFIFFYRSPHVKATCEFRDSKERWTDRCPLPVIALLCVMVMWTFGLFALAFSNWVFPLFGIILSGLQGMMVVVPLIILSFFIIHGVYRLRPWAWWAALFFLSFWFASFSLTFYFNDFMTYYEAMGYSEVMLQHLKKSADTMQPFFTFVMPLYAIFPIVFLLFIRKYFYRGVPSNTGNTSSGFMQPGD